MLIAVAGYIILRDGVQSGGGGAANGHKNSLVPPQNKHVCEANRELDWDIAGAGRVYGT